MVGFIFVQGTALLVWVNAGMDTPFLELVNVNGMGK